MPHVYVEGIGLSNVRERLRVLYGTDFHLDIESHAGQGTRHPHRRPPTGPGNPRSQRVLGSMGFSLCPPW